MSSDIVIRAHSISKGFESYERPADRLKRSMFALLARVTPIPTLRSVFMRCSRECVRTFWALKGLDFEIARGETVGIIGRNGSGKSTLLQVICGTLAPTEGEVRIDGRIAALLELGSGFDVEYTGRENIYLNAQLHGLTRQQIDERYDEIVAFADIGDFIDQPVKTYSSGMFVRLAFAVIAHVDADILVVDEALAVGDAFFTQKCMRFLRSFQQHGTVLFVSHDSSAVRSLCNRVIWLDRGGMREMGVPKDVCTHYFEAFYKQGQSKGDPSTGRDEANVDAQAQRIAALSTTVQTADQRQLFPRDPGAATAVQAAFGVDPHALPPERVSPLIESVQLSNEHGSAIHWVVGGEHVLLRIITRRPAANAAAVIAFFVKDRLGQPLFGDDTVLANTDLVEASSDALVAEFVFEMPILPPGDYAFTALVGTGSNARPTVLDCLHDALIIKSESPSVATGLVGIPMTNVALFILEANEAA
ncbi:ABC transporter ATP-binding protein [Trinickia soli]|uniref:ABC transporter ATP-binding protein n=1 Tax=Trinickia soli TaxID=380675 RepID=UPI0012519DD5|nr:ABC transporter ATP-binding protein [Paraburkholderia sp. T12-10]